jgi:hypothetical protein
VPLLKRKGLRLSAEGERALDHLHAEGLSV